MLDSFVGCYNPTWWSDFEHELASLDALRIIDEQSIEYYPNVASDNFSDAEWDAAERAAGTFVNKLYNDIENALGEWICNLPNGNQRRKIFINNNSLFLNFNYTDTLETLYGINANNILHIHGNATVLDNKLIFGHGTSREELDRRIKLEFDDDSTMAFISSRARDSVIYEIAYRKKDTEQIIQENKAWFESLASIKHLHFYGFSFSDIDMPYISEIFSDINKTDVTVEFSFYNENDQNRIKQIINRYHISNYKCIQLSNLEIL